MLSYRNHKILIIILRIDNITKALVTTFNRANKCSSRMEGSI